jgi:hypothetical protein
LRKKSVSTLTKAERNNKVHTLDCQRCLDLILVADSRRTLRARKREHRRGQQNLETIVNV